MVLHSAPYNRVRETVVGFPFTTKGVFLGKNYGNVYPSLSLFTFFSSIYSAYIEWIHVIQILQIHKFQHQIRVAICNWLVVLNILLIQPGFFIGQSSHVRWCWSLSYRKVHMRQLLGHLNHGIGYAQRCLKLCNPIILYRWRGRQLVFFKESSKSLL